MRTSCNSARVAWHLPDQQCSFHKVEVFKLMCARISQNKRCTDPSHALPKRNWGAYHLQKNDRPINHVSRHFNQPPVMFLRFLQWQFQLPTWRFLEATVSILEMIFQLPKQLFRPSKCVFGIPKPPLPLSQQLLQWSQLTCDGCSGCCDGHNDCTKSSSYQQDEHLDDVTTATDLFLYL